MKYFIGAYSATPTLYGWDKNLEIEFMKGIHDLDILGLELPFTGEIHPYDPIWFENQMSASWDYTFTCIPGTMDRIKLDPNFGLASPDQTGSRNALDFAFSAIDKAKKLNDKFSRQAVKYIQIHSAPKNIAKKLADKNIFRESLQKILEYNNNEVIVNIEHCDSFKSHKITPKAFLSIEDEIQAVQEIGNANLKFLINWGRSAIDSENVDAPIQHIKMLKQKNLLNGLFFSGATRGDQLYGDWLDTHAPFNNPLAATLYPQSLLTEHEVVRCLREIRADKQVYLGIKMQYFPKDLTAKQRIQCVKDSITFLDFCVEKSKL